MEIIRPLKLGTMSQPDSESRLVCRTILLDMLGEATITVENGDLAGVTGLFWKHIDLSLATLYLPKTPLRLTANGTGTPDIVMLRATDGLLIVHHRQQTFTLASRDVILLPVDTSSEIVLQGGRFDCAHLPHSAIAPVRKTLECLLLRRFQAECLPLQLLTNYAGYLLRQDHQDKDHASMMVAHFYSLLPVLAQQVKDGTNTPDVPQNRVESMKALIEDNLADGSFSITDLAKAEGITPRAIQKIFSRTGTTFSRFLLERRLVLAKNLIMADTAARPISQIVYSVGFNDLSYFNRTFRSRYGVRPTDLRRMAGQKEEV